MQFSESVRRIGPTVVAAVGIAAAPGALTAQDAESAEEARTAPDPWTATAELSFTSASGNRDLTVFTTGLTLKHRNVELLGLVLNLRARYGSSDGETDIENYHGDLKLDLDPANDWSPFLYMTAERDQTRRLDLRMNSGAGATYKLRRDDGRGEASIGAALLHSYESIRPATPSPPTTHEPHSVRWSFQFDGRQRIRDDVTVTHGTSFEPRVDRFDDHLLALRTTFKVLVTSRIALSLTHEFDRDSTPVSDEIDEHDHLLQAGILVEL